MKKNRETNLMRQTVSNIIVNAIADSASEVLQNNKKRHN